MSFLQGWAWHHSTGGSAARGGTVAPGGGGSPPAVVDITATDSSVDPTDATTFTFSSQSFGAAAADRKIIIGMGHRGSAATVTSITVGGVAATSVVESPSSGAEADRACIFIADVPTGTTGNVVVVLLATATRCGIGVWRMTGAGSSTPTDTGISSADPSTTTLTIAANGGGVGYGITTGATLTFTLDRVLPKGEYQVRGYVYPGIETIRDF